MSIKPWYNLVSPREDLRSGKPLAAADFAVHLEHVRRGVAPEDYVQPDKFFQRTYLTKNLLELAAQTVRRLSGITTETSAVFNMTTQFGGGKTHSLTLLYHLATQGNRAKSYQGVADILSRAEVSEIPIAGTAIFVGTEFSSLSGRSEAGEPTRWTPWGEIAFQVGGVAGYELVKQHDEEFISPGGDDLEKIFDPAKPYLLLLDEILNYVSRHRKYRDLGAQFYHFMQTLTEFVRSRPNIVLAVSIPASELEMTPDDQADFDRYKKMLDRLGRPIFMSAEKETTEIIRRRLFEWTGSTEDMRKTVAAYVHWLQDHRSEISSQFNIDHATEEFMASYPFHPAVISLFERKWQSLPRFQQTRGILRLLALWVSKAYRDGFENNTKDALITLGTAPLEDSSFRAAAFEQLGETRLEAAVTTDIIGKSYAHAERLDKEAVETVRKARLHRKTATIIFFESNGGQSAGKYATRPEIKLSIGEPDLDIGLLENVLQALLDSCYYLTALGDKYKFSTQENLNKRFSDRKASIKAEEVQKFVEEEVIALFKKTNGWEKVLFPERNNAVPDRPALTLVLMHPYQTIAEKETHSLMDDIMQHCGHSSRQYKNALIFAVSDIDASLKEDARKHLAWKAVQDEMDELNLDAEQRRQVQQNAMREQKSLIESIWKAYRHLVMLGKNNQLESRDLGNLHSSQSKSLNDFYLNTLLSSGELTQEISPNFLSRNWAPALVAWSTRQLRDAVYASPVFPRLLHAEAIKNTISKGVASGVFAYVGKKDGKYEPFHFQEQLYVSDIEITEDMYIINRDEALRSKEPPMLASLTIVAPNAPLAPGSSYALSVNGYDQHGNAFPVDAILWSTLGGEVSSSGLFKAVEEGTCQVTAIIGDIKATARIIVAAKTPTASTPQANEPASSTSAPASSSKKISWSGQIHPQKWNTFYTKILSRFGTNPKLKITVHFEVEEDSSVAEQKSEEMKAGLREMGLEE